MNRTMFFQVSKHFYFYKMLIITFSLFKPTQKYFLYKITYTIIFLKHHTINTLSERT